MNKTITVKGIHEHEAERSQSIRNYIDDKLSKIEKLLSNLNDPVYCNITVEIHKQHAHHICDLRIHGPHNFEVIVKKEGPEAYKVIDAVLDIAKLDIIKLQEKNFKK